MTYADQLDAIEKLRAMGAVSIRLEGMEVHFAAPPAPPAPTRTKGMWDGEHDDDETGRDVPAPVNKTKAAHSGLRSKDLRQELLKRRG